MEITGNIKQIQELVTGTSKAGKEWSKQTVIVTTADKYPQDIPVDFMGDSVEQLNNFQEGNPVTVAINLRGSSTTVDTMCQLVDGSYQTPLET